MRLFADFYQSDVIVASPVALATKLAEKEDGGADFLSSIEVWQRSSRLPVCLVLVAAHPGNHLPMCYTTDTCRLWWWSGLTFCRCRTGSMCAQVILL